MATNVQRGGEAEPTVRETTPSRRSRIPTATTPLGRQSACKTHEMPKSHKTSSPSRRGSEATDYAATLRRSAAHERRS
jgi:hypothetical protein